LLRAASSGLGPSGILISHSKKITIDQS
jgi:hypothetical protein